MSACRSSYTAASVPARASVWPLRAMIASAIRHVCFSASRKCNCLREPAGTRPRSEFRRRRKSSCLVGKVCSGRVGKVRAGVPVKRGRVKAQRGATMPKGGVAGVNYCTNRRRSILFQAVTALPLTRAALACQASEWIAMRRLRGSQRLRLVAFDVVGRSCRAEPLIE